ncbi:MAG TPA: M3 family metallopeptidase [Acidobacteriaceae bacterium]|nr:M3 family metallopeptidase [Acidobacteriaceae bacterium]
MLNDLSPLAANPPDDLHAWAGALEPDSLKIWVDRHLQAHQTAIAQLLTVQEPRTVENSLAPYDRAIAALGIAGSEAGLLHSVCREKAVRTRAEAMVQAVSDAAVQLSLNPQVYHALSAIDISGLDAASKHYLERTLLQYRLAGVDKDQATRQMIQQLQERITELGLAFGRNVQEKGNTVVVEDASELEGLPEDFLARHPADADGRRTLTTDYPDYQPVMTFAKSDSLRRRMFLAYNTRAYPANKAILMEILSTRKQLANTLGFDSWANLATADQMMGSAAKVKAFLAELDAASKAGAAREYSMVLEFARKQRPGLTAIDASSAMYWYEQYRRAAFDFDSQSVRPYFPYQRVQQGILDTAAKLFHVEFRPAPLEGRDAAARWDSSVTAWDVYDRSSKNRERSRKEPENLRKVDDAKPEKIGRFYLDMHPREGKDKWFSAFPLVPGIAGVQVPEAALICNFPGGDANAADPGLMQYSDVVTFFHEFGHLMHAILGGQQRWAGVSGIATEGDFVEVPSQLLEEFFRNAKLLAGFARHYETGEPIPAELVERMNRASAFGRGNGVRGQLFYTRFSLDLHNIDPATIDLDSMMQAGYTAALPYTWVDGNRLYSSFTHLVGYSSNYYTYLFDKVIALDFFQQFDANNLVEGPAALRYRKEVLEPGGSQPGEMLVQNFLRRAQSLQGFEAWLTEEFANSAC